MAKTWDLQFRELFNRHLLRLLLPMLPQPIVEFEVLNTAIPVTIERLPDVVIRVRFSDDTQLLIHIEVQTTNDSQMVNRMNLYQALLRKEYEQSPLQIVIYAGRGPLTMEGGFEHTFATGKRVIVEYHVLDFRDFDPEFFLAIDEPETVSLAILCGTEDYSALIEKILYRLQLLTRSSSELSYSKSIVYLRSFAKLRGVSNIVEEKVAKMPFVFNIKEDSCYQQAWMDREGEVTALQEIVHEKDHVIEQKDSVIEQKEQVIEQKDHALHRGVYSMFHEEGFEPAKIARLLGLSLEEVFHYLSKPPVNGNGA